MAGFTPSVVSAVWMGHYDGTAPIFGVSNNTEAAGSKTPYVVFGHDDPGLMWQTYMNAVLGNQPVQQFATYTDINGTWNFANNTPLNQTPASQSSQPNNPGGGGGNNTSTTNSTTTNQTPTDTTGQGGGHCGLICQPSTGGGGPGGGNGNGHGGGNTGGPLPGG
jgi:membrane peptidoglycan carboxypeptidase